MAASELACLFLCLRCRAGLCDLRRSPPHGRPSQFLCPRCRAGLCDDRRPRGADRQGQRFYALGVGLDFATHDFCAYPVLFGRFLCPRCRAGLCDFAIKWRPVDVAEFLCPRCRAGLCDGSDSGGRQAHGCVSMPSVSGWALRRPSRLGSLRHAEVSMPSVSGWALRRMPLADAYDLRVWCPLRHPRRRAGLGQGFLAPFPQTCLRPARLTAPTEPSGDAWA
jgi:hypothetical protein